VTQFETYDNQHEESALNFESSKDALIPALAFYLRLAKSFGATLLIVAVSLGMGTAGYVYFGNLQPVDGLLNAAMILTGMGPVDKMETTAGKLFATFYALYSGIAFLSMIAILMAPLLHRFMHRFHLEE
jgi:hypothetical protein